MKLLTKNISLPKLYCNYKRTSDDDIRKYLSQIKIVKEINNKYRPLNKEWLEKIIKKPRGHSLTLDVEWEYDAEPNLTEYKKITYLVKSSSRFFLKPDIGEIFDQIEPEDLDKLKAICFINEHELLEATEGEHFLMPAILMTEDKFSYTKEPFLK